MGARRADAYGREIAERIARCAAQHGVAVVSGGAYGVDITAHRAALDAGGTTVAVLGSGIDQLKPAAHARDFRRMMQQGAVVSPYALGQAPTPWTYPRRNPWIAALADGLVVVQAALKSGTLYSAHAALHYGRPVWVVPGPMDHPLHAGCHALVARGAMVLTSAEAWLEPLGLAAPRPRKGPAAPDFGADLWHAATGEARPINELAERAGLDIGSAVALATELELTGWLRAAPGGRFARARPDGAE